MTRRDLDSNAGASPGTGAGADADAGEGARRVATVLFERYSDDFDLRHGGGIERALYQLSTALAARGVRVHWYRRQDCPDAQALARRAAALSADAVFPLPDSPLFWRQAPSTDAGLRARVVRIWHDVGALTHGRGVVLPCDRHRAGGDPAAPCSAAHAHPALYAADVCFRDEPWTRCFPRRQVIPWAVDHLPRLDHRDRDGPVLLLAGKARLEIVTAAVDACRARGVPVRVIFSGWTTLGRQAKAHFDDPVARAGCDVVRDYRLDEDHARVFGGISAAFVLSQYHETFNFLAAECVHFGLPVVGLRGAGATDGFASLLVDDAAALRAVIAQDRFRALAPKPMAPWGWDDVAAAYLDLIGRATREDGAPCDAGPRAHPVSTP
ncbi:glycosyltransferase family 4 protein [Roseateles aquatilis]|nr:glycosyltransferase family 4 protein [Roseateles aquatilis]